MRLLHPGIVAGPRLGLAYEDLRRVAATSLNVVLVGEVGSGKRLFARALHQLAGRCGRLVTVGCGSLAEFLPTLRRSVTASAASSAGAKRGFDVERDTLFLDDIEELAPELQGKLAGVLRGAAASGSGIRVVTSARRPLPRGTELDPRQSELHAELCGAHIQLPAIRSRREEVLPLFERAFAAETGAATPVLEADAAERLCLHDWPFNGLEIARVAQLAAAQYPAERVLGWAQLRGFLGEAASSHAAALAPTSVSPSDAEQVPLLLEALRASAGNMAAAARSLGISRPRAYRLQLGLSISTVATLLARARRKLGIGANLFMLSAVCSPVESP